MDHRDNSGDLVDDAAQSAQISEKKPAVNGAEINKSGKKRQSLPQTPELLNYKQTADMFGVSISTIRRWIDPTSVYYRKDFPKIERYGVRLRKFRRGLLYDFLEKTHGHGDP